MDNNAYNFFKSKERMDEKTVIEKMLNDGFAGDTTSFLKYWEEIRSEAKEKLKEGNLEPDEFLKTYDVVKFATKAILFTQDLQKSNPAIIFEQLENEIKKSYDRQVEIIKEKRNLANKFAATLEDDSLSPSEKAENLKTINQSFNDLDIEGEKLKASIDENIIQMNNIDANFNLSELKPSNMPFLSYDETADIYKRIIRSENIIKANESSYTNNILDSISLMANINLRSIQSETFNYDKMIEDVEKELSYENSNDNKQDKEQEENKEEQVTEIVDNSQDAIDKEQIKSLDDQTPVASETPTEVPETIVEPVINSSEAEVTPIEENPTIETASVEQPKEEPVETIAPVIEQPKKPEQEETITPVVEQVEEKKPEEVQIVSSMEKENDPKLLAAITQYKSIVSVINSLVASVNLINSEEYALLSNTQQDISNFVAKEQEAAKLSNQIFDKKLELSKLEYEFYTENKYALGLNSEISSIKIDEIEINNDFTSFVEAHNSIIDANYVVVKDLTSKVSGSSDEMKNTLISEIDKHMAIIDMEKSIISRRALLEKQNNKSFDIINFYKENNYLNRMKKNNTNSESIQENTEQIIKNEEVQPVIETTTPATEIPQVEEPTVETKTSIKIHKTSLNFNTTQKVNTLKASITRGNLITIKILKDAIKIEYNKYLVDKLNELKLQVQTVASYNQEGQKNINIGGIEQLDNGKQVQMINNPQELENATIAFVDGNNQVVADYNIYDNPEVKEAVNGMSK